MNNLLFLFFTVIALSNCVKYKTADLVVHNARIYTVNQEFEVAQAMAIKDGIIIAIGKEHEIMNKFRAEEIYDAETLPIYPGFMDAHCHFMGSGLNSLAVDLSKVTTLEEMTSTLQKHQSSHPKSKWIVGYGWDENNWKFSLDSVFRILNQQFEDKPVMLWRVDGHSLLVNHNAQIKSGYSFLEQTNGLILEEDIPLFTRAVQYTETQKKNGLRYAQENFLSKGVTTVTDAGITPEELELMKKMFGSGTLSININAMLFFSETASRYLPFSDSNKLTANTYKVMLDGSVGSQTACFTTPYLGTNSYGKLLMSRDSLHRICELAHEQGAQLAVHAIGDSAVKVALEVMGKVLKGTNGLGWRIEHAQTVSPEQLAIFRKFAIIPSVQPTHLYDDQNMAEQRLPLSMLYNSYRLKSLLEQNQSLALGTDFPVASASPIHTFYHSVYRANKPWVLQKENLTREEALRGITFWVALANKSYERNGSLEVGKQADFVLLNHDIMKIPKEEILETEVLRTYVSGGLVYSKLN